MIWNIWECNIWLCDWVRSVGQQMIDSLRPSGKTQIIHIHAGNTEGIKLIVLNFPALWHENIVRIDFFIISPGWRKRGGDGACYTKATYFLFRRIQLRLDPPRSRRGGCWLCEVRGPTERWPMPEAFNPSPNTALRPTQTRQGRTCVQIYHQ